MDDLETRTAQGVEKNDAIERLISYGFIKLVETDKHKEAFFKLVEIAFQSVTRINKDEAAIRGICQAPIPTEKQCIAALLPLLKQSELWRKFLDRKLHSYNQSMHDGMTQDMVKYLVNKHYDSLVVRRMVK